MTLDLITLKYECFALSVSSQALEATVVRGGKEGLNNPRCALARLAYLGVMRGSHLIGLCVCERKRERVKKGYQPSSFREKHELPLRPL